MNKELRKKMCNLNKKDKNLNFNFLLHTSGFGFTLIELLVVISIIGILVALGTARFSVAEKRARDAQRMSDLNQYRVALENYATANNSIYPGVAANGVISTLCGVATFAETYLSGSCMQDPVFSTTTDYTYYSNPNGTGYTLSAVMETEAENTYFIVCSNGRSGRKVLLSVPTDGSCPL